MKLLMDRQINEELMRNKIQLSRTLLINKNITTGLQLNRGSQKLNPNEKIHEKYTNTHRP